MATIGENDLLDLLHSHGQAFMSSFSLPKSNLKKRKRNTEPGAPTSNTAKRRIRGDEDEDEESEWEGIVETTISVQNGGLKQGEIETFEQDDDGFASEVSPATNVVVFSDSKRRTTLSTSSSKAQMRAFMSSKVTKLRQDIPDTLDTKETQEEKEEDRTNAQNDTILHRLVHTKLLSGSLDPSLNLTPAHRRKALAGRVLELSGEAKLGKGEKIVREAERKKASKQVREGIAEKQREKDKQQLEEAKNLGNYHPAIKKLFDSSTSGGSSKKRDRGLRMGVGKFSGGFLDLRREEEFMARGERHKKISQRGPQRGGRGGRGYRGQTAHK